MRKAYEYGKAESCTRICTRKTGDPGAFDRPSESGALLGVAEGGAIGILTITPCEAALIAADVATKTAAVDIGFMDRFTGSVVLVGSVSAVEAALRQVNAVLMDGLGFTGTRITRS